MNDKYMYICKYTINIIYNFIGLEHDCSIIKHNYRKLQQQKWAYQNFK